MALIAETENVTVMALNAETEECNSERQTRKWW